MKCVILILMMLFLGQGCVKEEGKLPPSAINGSSSGGGSGGQNVSTGPDPLAAEAWHLSNSGQKAFAMGGGLPGIDISANGAIAQGFTGSGIKVAVSDTGTDHSHADLLQNSLTSLHRNYTHIDPMYWRGSLPLTSGDDAHGTAVTGLISALGWNGKGSRGVAPDSQFAGFKFVTTYSSSITSGSMLARTIDQTDGPFDIFNYSYGYTDCIFTEEDELVSDAIKSGITSLRGGKGAIYVQSSGNGYANYLEDCTGESSPLIYAHNTNFSNDTATPYKIIVAAVNASGYASSYSSPGSGIWVSAPGGEYGDDEPALITTDISGCSAGYSKKLSGLNSFNRGAHTLNPKCDYTSLMNGTSSSAPIISGVVALMLEAKPTLSWRDVKHILASTSRLIDPVNTPLPNPTGENLNGYIYDYKWNQNAADYYFSNWYGFGMVDADAAVNMAKNYDFPLGTYETTSNPNTHTWYYFSGGVNEVIPDADKDGVTSTIQVDHNFIIESVQVKVTIGHPKPGQLGIHLRSPAGVFESRLLNINNNVYAVGLPVDKILMTNAFYGEESAGEWELRVVDGKTGTTGTLLNWSILIHGHKVVTPGAIPFPISTITMDSNYASTNSSPLVEFIASPSTSIVRYEVSVGSAAGGTDKAKWYSIGKATSFQVPNLILTNNTYYYVNIRAIDNRERSSTVSSKYWRVSM